MKKVLRLLVIMLFVIIFTSCNKEEVTNQISDSDRIELIKKEMSQDKYLQTQENFFEAYHLLKNGGLKNATSLPNAKVCFKAPANEIYLLPNGEFKRIMSWMIVDNGFKMDEGIVVVRYDAKYNRIGDWEYLLGWKNEYCIPVNINSNFDNLQIRFTLSFPVDGGQVSFETYSNTERNVEMWLPQFKFDFLWEICGNSSFSGLLSFNPNAQNEINIQISNLYVNTNDYIKFDLIGISSNSIIQIQIIDSDGNYVDRLTLLFPAGKSIPGFIMIPLTFSPKAVEYVVGKIVNARTVYGESTRKSCFLVLIDNQANNPRTYVLR